MAYWCKHFRKDVKEIPATKKKEYDWKPHETLEDYPFPDYKAKHTYCQVAFDDSGKTFYYRTRNPELKVGDMVYVPVGYKYEQRIRRIVSMKEYKGCRVPYPRERTDTFR